MFNLKILLGLLANTFSLKRTSLRFISPRRLLAVLFLYPVFLLVLIINWLFLVLDELFFFSYRKMDLSKAIFIIGVPRSATTWIFNELYKDHKIFHGFKLWELVFAPSIIQKYFFLFVRWIDKGIGSPIYRFTRVLDRFIFGNFRNIHDMGICKPEEDEVLFLYNFSSLYFYYFYPDLSIMNSLLYHDKLVPEKFKNRNMSFYYRCIQRHKFVFDRSNKAYFLSKNPTFIPRMKSISQKFDSARFIYPLRSPYETIPSTISLNAHIFSNFCRLPEQYPLSATTRDFILSWYTLAAELINTDLKDRVHTVLYKDIKANPLEVIKAIYLFLNLNQEESIITKVETPGSEKKYKSKHNYDKSLGIDTEIINSRMKGILDPELLHYS